MDPLSLAAVVLVLAHSAWTVHRLQQAAAQEREHAAQERAEIMTRIQAPERIVLPQGDRPAPLHVVPEDEAELGKVGLILVGDGDDDNAA